MYSSSNIIIFIEAVRVCKEFHPTFVIKYKNFIYVNNMLNSIYQGSLYKFYKKTT